MELLKESFFLKKRIRKTQSSSFLQALNLLFAGRIGNMMYDYRNKYKMLWYYFTVLRNYKLVTLLTHTERSSTTNWSTNVKYVFTRHQFIRTFLLWQIFLYKFIGIVGHLSHQSNDKFQWLRGPTHRQNVRHDKWQINCRGKDNGW